MNATPYIPLGEKQQASTSDMASAIMDMIDELCLTDSDFEKVHEILELYEITWEA